MPKINNPKQILKAAEAVFRPACIDLLEAFVLSLQKTL
jgi:hypothetical protein